MASKKKAAGGFDVSFDFGASAKPRKTKGTSKTGKRRPMFSIFDSGASPRKRGSKGAGGS